VKGYRTLALNLAPGVVLMLDYAIGSGQILGLLIENPKTLAAVMLGLNLANIWIRFLTTTPVGKK
jgi:hypothetical protein